MSSFRTDNPAPGSIPVLEYALKLEREKAAKAAVQPQELTIDTDFDPLEMVQRVNRRFHHDSTKTTEEQSYQFVQDSSFDPVEVLQRRLHG
jgi:hypothetical protein